MQNSFIRCPRYKGRNFNLGAPSLPASLGKLPTMPDLSTHNPAERKTEPGKNNEPQKKPQEKTQVKPIEPKKQEQPVDIMKEAAKNQSEQSKKREKTAENEDRFGLRDMVREDNRDEWESEQELNAAENAVRSTVPSENMSRRVVYLGHMNFSANRVSGNSNLPLMSDPLANATPDFLVKEFVKTLPPGWWVSPAIGLGLGSLSALGIANGMIGEPVHVTKELAETPIVTAPVATYSDSSWVNDGSGDIGKGVIFKNLTASEIASLPKELPHYYSYDDFRKSDLYDGSAHMNSGKLYDFRGGVPPVPGNYVNTDLDIGYRWDPHHKELGTSGISDKELTRLFKNNTGSTLELPDDEAARAAYMKQDAARLARLNNIENELAKNRRDRTEDLIKIGSYPEKPNVFKNWSDEKWMDSVDDSRIIREERRGAA